jgi:hypothetical protein
MVDPRTDRTGGSMKAIAMALVSAANYIEVRDDTHFTVDNDVKALEDIVHALKDATPAEIDALISAANELGIPNWPKESGIVDE